MYFAIFRTSAIQLEYEPSRPAGKLESGLPYSNGGVPPSLVMPAALGEIAPELTGHGLPLIKCEAYNRVYDQSYRSR